MKISDYLIVSKKTITAYNKTCESVLEKYDISQVSFDILMFLTNNPEYVTAQDISEIKGDLYIRLVEPSGIEPLTSCVQGRRSPS